MNFRFQKVYYCHDGIELLHYDEEVIFEPIELPFTEVHNLTEVLATKGSDAAVLCFNRRKVRLPIGAVPTRKFNTGETPIKGLPLIKDTP